MKKITAIVLALVMLMSFAACGDKATDGNATDGNAVASYEGTLSELCAKMYETNPLELMVMTEGAPVDLTDPDALPYYLGVSTAEDFKEVIFSETMMGSQAYSLVLARVNDTAKTEDIKKAILENVDARKWICVEADQMRVASSADLIMFIMVDSQFGETIADDMVEAFKTNVGELTGETLSK